MELCWNGVIIRDSRFKELHHLLIFILIKVLIRCSFTIYRVITGNSTRYVIQRTDCLLELDLCHVMFMRLRAITFRI
jgi:hypothetical protein